MTTERWRQIEKVFEAVSELPADERKRRLALECAGDDALLREVESLLTCDRADDDYAERAVQGTAELLASENSFSMIGRRCGPYRLTRIIGHGGMGTVYEAVRDDDQYEQKVAVKVVRGGMDRPVDIHRFRRERQIQAWLDHPNIARLLDGGATPEGLPYLVMEYVEGQSITAYCHERGLSVEQKLRLILQVAAAVQYAHQKLVVHRDLKPGNILVTSDGVPKLLDFGVALLLQPDDTTDPGPRTYTTAWLLTPEYASPEQIRGEPVTAASDVYSLGVVLYELLTGKGAHRLEGRSAADIERAICQTDVEMPSVAAQDRSLQGDLNNILLMALRKEPNRRYASVEQFAEDLRRSLEARPVLARKDSFGYRCGIFLRRNRLTLAAATVVVLSLASGIVVATRQARLAERRFQQARQLAGTFLFDFDERLRRVPGTLAARSFLAETAMKYLDSLATEVRDDESLQWELARGYARVGELQGGDLRTADVELGPALGPGLGRPADAFATLRKAAAIQERLFLKHPEKREYRTLLVTIYFNLGALEPDTARGVDLIRKAYGIAVETKAPSEDQQAWRGRVRRVLMGLADVQLRAGDPKQAAATLAEVRGPWAQMLSGFALEAMGDLEQALGIIQGLIPKADRDWPLFRDKPLTYRHIGRFLILNLGRSAAILGNPRGPNLGRSEEALEYGRRAVAAAEELARVDADDLPVRLLLTDTYVLLAALLQESDPRQALELGRKALGASPTAAAHVEVAFALGRLGKREDALAELNRALDLEPPPETAVFIHHQFGDPAHDRQALAIAEKVVAEKPFLMPLRKALADCYERLGRFGDSLEIWNSWTNYGVSSVYSQSRKRQAESALNKSPQR